ncbi:MAG: TRAP transporter small permease subunit [Silicimonas sp.]|nr:TRAP transporter small permease subunit [Silicimonas sp.]
MGNRFERILLAIGAASVIAMGVLITANVIARSFGGNIPDSNIIVEELMVAAILLPLAIATGQRAHVVVEFVSDRFSPEFRSRLVVLGSVMGLIALAPLIYSGSRAFLGEWSSGSFYFGDLALPKWPGRLLYVIGLSACWIRLAMLAISDTARIRRGEIVSDKEGA